ncbi:MAG: Na(+)/H(+) antiporter subunit B [bacterium]
MTEVLLIVMLILAVVALLTRDLRVTVVVIGVFSLVSCFFYFVLGAPDVALTEAGVGTGIGTVVFIWIVHKTQRREDEAAPPEAQPRGPGPDTTGGDT